MATLTHRRLRLTLDCDKFDPPQDQRTRDIPRVYSGTDLSIEIGLFFAGEPVEVGPFASITCEVKDLVDNAAPPAGASALMLKSTEEFDGTTNKQSWDDFTKAHAVFSFTNEETNLAPGKKWIVFSAVTDDGKVITLACGIIEFLQDGTGPLGEAPEPQESYQTTATADAKYLHKANHLSEYDGDEEAKSDVRDVLDVLSEEDSDTRYLRKAEQLADLSDKEAARENLELGSAAIFDVPEFGDADSEQVVKGDDSRLTDARAPTTHTHAQSQVTNLVSDLAGKAASSHTHAQADVTSLVSDLAPPPAGPFLASGGAAAALTIPDGNAWTFGTDDFSLAFCLLQPSWVPTSSVLLAQKVNGNEGWKLWLLNTGVLRLELGNGTNFSTYRYDSTAAITTISGVAGFRAAHLALSADRDGNLLFAVNGVPLGAAVSISASAAQTLTTTGSVLILSDGTTHYPGRVHRIVPFNVALPASDATWRLDLARITRGFAIPQAMRYGEAGDYYAANATANAATNGAADANNATGWTNAGTWVCSAQAGARDGGAGAYVLRITSGATPNSSVITAAVIRVHRSGQRLRVSFWARKSAGNGQTTIPFYIRAGSSSTLVHTFTGLTTNWQLFTAILTVPEGDSTRNEMGLGMSSGIAQNEYMEVDDFQLTAQGALALYDPASLNPCQWRDWGTNQAHSDIFPTTVQVLDFPPGGDFVVTRRFVAGTNEPSSTAATTPLLRLPPHAAILAFHSKSAVGYDASTTFDIGITGTQAKFASAINVAATAETYTASLSLAKESRTAFTNVWIKRNQSVTVGDATIDTFCRMAGGPLL